MWTKKRCDLGILDIRIRVAHLNNIKSRNDLTFCAPLSQDLLTQITFRHFDIKIFIFDIRKSWLRPTLTSLTPARRPQCMAMMTSIQPARRHSAETYTQKVTQPEPSSSPLCPPSSSSPLSADYFSFTEKENWSNVCKDTTNGLDLRKAKLHKSHKVW